MTSVFVLPKLKIRGQIIDVTQNIIELAVKKIILSVVVEKIIDRLIDASIVFLTRSRKIEAKIANMIAHCPFILAPIFFPPHLRRQGVKFCDVDAAQFFKETLLNEPAHESERTHRSPRYTGRNSPVLLQIDTAA